MLDIHDTDITFRLDNLRIRVVRIGYGVFYNHIARHIHGRGFYEAHFVQSGKGMLIVDTAHYPLESGIACMTGPLVPHAQITDQSDPMDEYYLQFEIKEDEKHAPSVVSSLLRDTTFWIGTDTQKILPLFAMLTEEDEKRGIGYSQSVVNITRQILIALVRNYSGSEKRGEYSKIKPDDKRIITTDESFLYDHASITLVELSRRLSLSERQTQRFLKKTYGKTFIEMRTEERRRHAEELMHDGMSAAQAALSVGYSDARSIAQDGACADKR